jgi:uncharacterized membrane protein YfcA
MVDGRRAAVAFPAGFLGSLAGAALVMLVRPQALRPVVLALLIAVAFFLAFRPPVERRASGHAPRRSARAIAAAIALVIGAYDGFFGPGTGTFLIVAFVLLLGDELAFASANAKVVNFASNLAAMLLFASRGTILWRVALPMAAGELAGGWIGAHFAVRGGDRLVRRVVLVVVVALSIKVGTDLFASGFALR